MNTGTILHLRPGKVVEKSVLEAVMTVYPTVNSFAVQHEGELAHEAFTTPLPIEGEGILKLIDECKDGHRVLFFGNYPKFEKDDSNDLPPFIVTNAEGAPCLAIFAEGPFPGYIGKDNYTPVFNMMNEVVFAAIEKAGDPEGDIDKTIANLRGSSEFKKTLLNTIPEESRGWFMFLPYTGEPWCFGKNKDMMGFPWGTISNMTNLNALRPVEEKPVEKKSPLGFLAKRKTAEAVPQEVKPVKDPAPVLPVETPTPADTVPNTDTKIIWKMVEVPKSLNGGVKNAWIRLFNGSNAIGLVGGEGELPQNHQSKSVTIPVHPSLVPFTSEVPNDAKSMKNLKDKVMKSDQAGKLVTFEKKESKSSVREPSANYTTPTMSEDSATKAMEKMLKYLDTTSKARPTPIDIQKTESKWPVFSSKIGVDFNELLLLSVDQISDLFDKNDIATCAFIEMRRKYIEGMKVDLNALAAPAKGDEPTAAKASGELVQSKPAQPVVEKKSNALGFLAKKKVA